ncbi:DUF4329 domain-containing protein [Pseudomonas sp. LB3P81]
MNDVLNRQTRAAVPPPKARLPKLSPEFLTEEDAAYWVHDQIPANSDREYGSVIVRSPDGYFAATRPVPGEVDRFDLRTILDTDARGNYVHPHGYTCVANVHTHPPAHDKVREANPGIDEFTVRLFINFFSNLDVIADISERTFFTSAYLSGPDGLLLKYSPSGSQEEFSYYLWLLAGAPPGNPVGVFGVVNIIRKVASIGELKVIVSNADWTGSVGKVPSDWQPGKPFSKGVVTTLPLMTRICASAERAVLAALKTASAQTSGLVLKNSVAKDYVATQARPAGVASWDPVSFFPPGDDGKLKWPDGYELEGFYYASRPDPANFPRKQHWLYENFFTPDEMALAVECHARSKPLLTAGRPLSLYMQAMDSAMLKYSFSGSQLEAALSVKHPDGTIDAGGLQSRVQTGLVGPREFVSAVLLAGRLDVVRGSTLWKRLGAVGVDWIPYADFSWPMLSPAFLSADDAARYVHANIDSRRDWQYAGYIFQRADKRFIATEPLEGGIDSIRRGLFFPLDNAGRSVFPDEHVLQGHYVSHEELSRLDPLKVERLKWSRQEAALSMQSFSVEEMRQVLLDEIPLFLSGARNSPVRFEPLETPAARLLESRLGTRTHAGPLAVALDTGTTRPGDFIREQAAAGRLTVLVNSELWGARGQVSASWIVPSVPSKWIRPEQAAFGAVFSSADDAAQDRYSRDTRLNDEEKAWFGFILKHQDREEYVSTELVPVDSERNTVFQLQSVFGVSRTPPWYLLPEGFIQHAFFYSHRRVRLASPEAGSWLGQYFIVPDDLYLSVRYSQRRPVMEPHEPIPLYIATQDGALLKYVNRGGSKLFDDGTPHMGLESIKNNLASGKLLPADFVKVVANSGELSVMRTSLCWDRAWPVDLKWRPYMNLERRWLSPAFYDPDDAVVHARSRLPVDAKKRFGGVVLTRADGLYVATDPIEVSREDFNINEIYPDESVITGLFPAGCRVAGRYRSRVVKELPLVLSEIEKQTYLNMLSVDTVYTAFTRPSATALDEYLFGPDGSVIRYRTGLLSRLHVAKTLIDFGSLPPDLDGKKIKQKIYDGALKPSEWVDFLTKADYLQVVTGSRLWGARGPLTGWVPYPAVLPSVLDYTKAVTAPACSPVFVQDDAVARHVHDASGSRTALTFGFILWSDRDGVFFANMPVEAQRSQMALDRVFLDGALPARCALHALYFSAQRAPEGELDDDSRQFFFSPIDVHQMCAAAYTPQGYRPIYFSCADGALLRFDMAPFEPGEFYDEYGQAEIRSNQFASLEQATGDERDILRGTINLSDYIHRMAKAGKLEVIVTSDYWSRHGVVGEDWQPRMPDASSDEYWAARPVPALGPVFDHADDAARYAQQRAGSGIDRLDAGYEGAILARVTSRRFVPLEPVAISAYGDNPFTRIFRTAKDPSTTWRNPSPRYPDGYTLVASHQFYLSGNTTLAPDTEEVYANFAAPSLVYAHTHDLRDKGFQIKDYYYSSPHGVLLRYTPGYTRAEKDLLLTKPVDFAGGKWVERLSPATFISSLVDLGDFRVLIAGHYWRQTGRMGTKWRERRKQSSSLVMTWSRDEL